MNKYSHFLRNVLMNNILIEMKNYLIICLIGVLAFPAAAQEDSIKRNNISIAPFVLLNRTIPLSYSRYLKENWNFTLYTRVRFAKDDGTTIEQGWFEGIDTYNQPYIYSRVFLRTGVQYHKKWYLVEPLLQLDYGWLKDRTLVVQESEGFEDVTEVQDRDYYSAGIVILAGTYHDFDTWRIRTFAGIGTHLKYFQVDAKSSWNADPDWEPYYEEYFKFMLSVHLGIEIGLNF